MAVNVAKQGYDYANAAKGIQPYECKITYYRDSCNSSTVTADFYNATKHHITKDETLDRDFSSYILRVAIEFPFIKWCLVASKKSAVIFGLLQLPWE